MIANFIWNKSAVLSHFCSLPVVAAVRTNADNAVITKRKVDVFWAGYLHIFKSCGFQRDHCKKYICMVGLINHESNMCVRSFPCAYMQVAVVSPNYKVIYGFLKWLGSTTQFNNSAIESLTEKKSFTRSSRTKYCSKQTPSFLFLGV